MVKNSFRHVAFDAERLIAFMEKTRTGDFARSLLRMSLVERVREAGEGNSVIVLTSGYEIPVALDHETLTQKIFMPDFKTDDAGVLDLIAVTGAQLPPAQQQAQPVVKKKAVVKNGEMQPGDRMPDGTIYLGVYAPEGHGLSQVFNVYAAPQDISKYSNTYSSTLRIVSQLKNWFGYNGCGYETENDLYHAIATGTYGGEWIVPPGEILSGKDITGAVVMENCILANKDKGAFKDSLDGDKWYWTSTHKSGNIANIRFSSGSVSYSPSGDEYRCRPVRLVQISP